jgi:hypothetical protein
LLRRQSNVRFTPESGHVQCMSAKCQKQTSRRIVRFTAMHSQIRPRFYDPDAAAVVIKELNFFLERNFFTLCNAVVSTMQSIGY